jgi:hypothetical protein
MLLIYKQQINETANYTFIKLYKYTKKQSNKTIIKHSDKYAR